MRSLLILIVLLVAGPTAILGQKIRVIDAGDRKPIKNVAVYNESQTRFGYTDLAGEFNIDAFAGSDQITFQHPSYHNIELTMEQIKANGYVVSLTYRTFEIDEFVVSASRWEQNKEEVPNKITQIRKPFIDFVNPQTAADLLGASDEVFIQKSQLGGGSPMIRGFSTSRVLLVVDGVRMNNAIFREGNVQNVISLDPNIIESSEIIFGPGAIVYGSDALGGVMDFHTMKALLSTSKKPNIKINTMARTSTANSERSGHIDINIGGIKIAFLSSFSYSSFDDLRMGSVNHPDYVRPEYVKRIDGNDTVLINSDPNLQLFSGYTQYNLTEKLRFQPTEELNVVFSTHISATSDFPRYDRLIQYRSDDRLRYGEWYYGPQKWMMNNISVDWKPEKRLFDAVKLVVARQDFAESRHSRNFDDPVIHEPYEEVIAYTLNADFEKTFGNNLLFYGIEAVNNQLFSEAESRDIVSGAISPEPARYPDGDNKYNTLAGYAGIKINFSDKLILNSGFRYNFFSLYSTFIDNSYYNFPFSEISIDGSALTGSAGIVIIPGEKTQLHLNASTGYRAPNIDDAGKVFDSEPGNVVVPNPDLKPEYAYNVDVGISRDMFDLFHIEATGFLTFLDNAMVRREFSLGSQDSILYLHEMSKVLAIVNTGSATIYGAHLGLQVSPVKNFRLKSNLNFTRGEDQDGVPMRHVAPLHGSAHLIYESKKLKFDLYANYNGVILFEDMPPSESSKAYLYATDDNDDPYCPSWYTFNLKASYQVGNIGILNAGIENILDHRYRPYSSGIVSPGRNFMVALRVII